jgi:RND superfamily putative drug exporter
MDFEVFSVSQIKEHADAGEDPKRSVVSGLLTSGRSIAAAATIMGFWFGSFVLNGDPTVKPFGIGLALAVILDARAVRCLLVPARTASLGKANWYLPPLARPDPPPHQHRVREVHQARDRIPAAIQLQALQVPAARP